MTIRKKHFNGEPYLECETTQDWIDALWMDPPIDGPAEVKIACLEAEVRNLRRIAVEAILCLRREKLRRETRSRRRAGRATQRARRNSGARPDRSRSRRRRCRATAKAPRSKRRAGAKQAVTTVLRWPKPGKP